MVADLRKVVPRAMFYAWIPAEQGWGSMHFGS